MAALHITLMGGFAAHRGSGEALALKGRKTQALLAYLALGDGAARPRDQLVALLWSDRGEQQARSSLRQSLTELRKALGDGDAALLIAGRDAVSLDASAVDLDVRTFDRLIEEATPAALEQAAALYRGELLDGFVVHDPAFEDWLRGERRRLHERATDALSRLHDHQAAANPEVAVATARRLLALDPLREATHRALMRLYASQGERALALKQYHACRDLLGAELAVEPEPETERLAEEIRSGTVGMAETAAPAPESRSGPLALPDRPSIAVLPFVNLSGDPEQDYFADGITEDIITELSRFRDLFVIARNSSFFYKGKSVKVQDIGLDLGVAYVVEGSIRQAGDRVRVNAQMVEAATGSHVWAERYDRDLEDIFAVQDEAVRAIVAAVAPSIASAQLDQARRKPPENLTAYECYLRGQQLHLRNTKEDCLAARALFEKAIKLDPNYATAYAWLAVSYYYGFELGWSDTPDATLRTGLTFARRAVELDPLNNYGHLHVAYGQFYSRQYDIAWTHLERAEALNPNDADMLGLKGMFEALLGRMEDALRSLERAWRLNPLETEWYMWNLAVTFHTARRYEEAVNAYRRLINPANEVLACLAACHAQLGDEAAARDLMCEFHERAKDELANYPGDDTEGWRTYWSNSFPYKDPADLENLLDGLRKAGLPV